MSQHSNRSTVWSPACHEWNWVVVHAYGWVVGYPSCDVTLSYVWHDSFLCVTCRGWHSGSIAKHGQSMTWLIHTCVTWLSFICAGEDTVEGLEWMSKKLTASEFYMNTCERVKTHTNTYEWVITHMNTRKLVVKISCTWHMYDSWLIHMCPYLWRTWWILWMSHVTFMNESCHTYHTHEWVMAHTWVSHGTHMSESWHTHEWVMAHTWVSHGTHMSGSWHTREWVPRIPAYSRHIERAK